jgi:hypothetical protein
MCSQYVMFELLLQKTNDEYDGAEISMLIPDRVNASALSDAITILKKVDGVRPFPSPFLVTRVRVEQRAHAPSPAVSLDPTQYPSLTPTLPPTSQSTRSPFSGRASPQDEAELQDKGTAVIILYLDKLYTDWNLEAYKEAFLFFSTKLRIPEYALAAGSMRIVARPSVLRGVFDAPAFDASPIVDVMLPIPASDASVIDLVELLRARETVFPRSMFTILNVELRADPFTDSPTRLPTSTPTLAPTQGSLVLTASPTSATLAPTNFPSKVPTAFLHCRWGCVPGGIRVG